MSGYILHDEFRLAIVCIYYVMQTMQSLKHVLVYKQRIKPFTLQLETILASL